MRYIWGVLVVLASSVAFADETTPPAGSTDGDKIIIIRLSVPPLPPVTVPTEHD